MAILCKADIDALKQHWLSTGYFNAQQYKQIKEASIAEVSPSDEGAPAKRRRIDDNDDGTPAATEEPELDLALDLQVLKAICLVQTFDPQKYQTGCNQIKELSKRHPLALYASFQKPFKFQVFQDNEWRDTIWTQTAEWRIRLDDSFCVLLEGLLRIHHLCPVEHSAPDSIGELLGRLDATIVATQSAMLKCFRALIYREGLAGEENPAEAIRLYDEAVIQGHVQAMVERAHLHRRIPNGPVNYLAICNLYGQARQAGNVDALVCIADLYRAGYITVQGPNFQSVELYRRAITVGNAEAMYKRAKSHQRGEDGLINFPRAIFLYEAAILRGHIDAKKARARMYIDGQGGRIDYDAGIALFSSIGDEVQAQIVIAKAAKEAFETHLAILVQQSSDLLSLRIKVDKNKFFDLLTIYYRYEFDGARQQAIEEKLVALRDAGANRFTKEYGPKHAFDLFRQSFSSERSFDIYCQWEKGFLNCFPAVYLEDVLALLTAHYTQHYYCTYREKSGLEVRTAPLLECLRTWIKDFLHSVHGKCLVPEVIKIIDELNAAMTEKVQVNRLSKVALDMPKGFYEQSCGLLTSVFNRLLTVKGEMFQVQVSSTFPFTKPYVVVHAQEGKLTPRELGSRQQLLTTFFQTSANSARVTAAGSAVTVTASQEEAAAVSPR